MSRDREEGLLSKAVSEQSVRPDGRYTVPRTYGVYAVMGQDLSFQFGSHPRRNKELVQKCGAVARIALFYNQEDAKELASLMNAAKKGL